MVYMKNIRQQSNLVTFDGYINGRDDQHFTMTVDLNNSKNSVASIDRCYDTNEAMLKIFYTFAERGALPAELVSMTY